MNPVILEFRIKESQLQGERAIQDINWEDSTEQWAINKADECFDLLQVRLQCVEVFGEAFTKAVQIELNHYLLQSRKGPAQF